MARDLTPDNASQLLRLSERLLFREFRPDDAAAVHAYRRLEEVKRFDVHGPNTLAEVEAIIKRAMDWRAADPRTVFFGAVCLQGNQELIGEFLLRIDAAQRSGEIGFMFSPSVWGNGYATETVTALLALARGMGLTEIVARCHRNNITAAQVLKRSGLHQDLEASGEDSGQDLRFIKPLDDCQPRS